MTDAKLINYLKKSFFTGAFKTIVVMLSTIFFLPLIIYNIGMEHYGLISATMILSGVAGVSDFGISKAVTLLLGDDANHKNAGSIVINALLINIFMLFLIGTALYILTAVYDISILGTLNIDKKLQNYIITVGFISLCIIMLNNLFMAILESYFLMHFINIGFMFSSVLMNLYIYLVSILSDSLYLLLLTPSMAFLTVNIYLIIIIIIYTDLRPGHVSLTQIKSMLKVSYKFLNISIVNSFVIPANKYFLLYFTGSSSTLGLFDVGLRIGMLANSLLNSIAEPLFGVFSRMNKNKEKIFKISKQVSTILFLFYFIGVSIFYFFGLNIVFFIDDSNVEALYNITLVLLIGASSTAVSEPFYRALIGTKRLNEALILKLLLPLLNILFYFILFNFTQVDRFVYAYSSALCLTSLTIIVYYIVIYKKGS